MTTSDRIAAMRIGEAEDWSALVPLGEDDPGASTLDGSDWGLITGAWYRNMQGSPADEAARWARLIWNLARQNRARYLASGRGPDTPLTPRAQEMQEVALTAAGAPDLDDTILDPRRLVAELIDRWPSPAKIRAVLASNDRDGEAWNRLRWTYKDGRWLFRWHDAGWLAPVTDPRLPGLLELRPALEAAFARDPVTNQWRDWP